MPPNRLTNRKVLLIALLLLLIAGIGAALWVATRPIALTLRLSDGTEAFYYSDTRITPAKDYPNPRTIEVDGEVFIRAAAAAEPLIVRTKLLVLTVTGRTALRVIAHSHENGEQADVLYGRVEAKKAYKSSYDVPDQLEDAQMVMINSTIDLMEKEKAEMPELRAWTNALVAAAARRARKY